MTKFVLDSVQEVVLAGTCVVLRKVLYVGQVEKGLTRFDVHARD